MIGADLMVRALGALERESLTLQPQAEEGVTYAAKIDKAEARVDWSKPARHVHNTIRGLSPFPGAWCEMEINGQLEGVKVLRSVIADGAGKAGETQAGEVLDGQLVIAGGDGAVALTLVQKAGGKPVSAAEFCNGVKLSRGVILP